MDGDLIVYVSDNESWIVVPAHFRYGASSTKTVEEWSKFRDRNPKAQMVCIDIQPYGTTQAAERDGVINVDGFSDQVFELIGAVSSGNARSGHWTRKIDAISL